MKICIRLIVALALLVVATICSPSAIAQELASLSGRITDPHGLPVTGVKVQAVNVNTNGAYPTETNDAGLYNIPALPPGTYRVIVDKQGFVQIIKPNVQLHVADIIAINFGLQVGSITQSVTVEAGVPLVNTQSGAVSTVIDRQFVESLPLNGRSFNTLLQLTPGVVIAPLTVNSLSTPGQFSIAGQRSDANNFVVDGVSANFGVGAGTGQAQAGTGSAVAFSAQGGTSSLVSVDALQEFRIETSSFAPELGRAPGGQIILSTRSGTNDFHGGIFDYFRNTVMDANDWFNNAATHPIAKPPEHHNDFGGFIGGPIWKDRTFFFLSYEGARLDLPQTTIIQVPSEFAKTQASTNAPAVLPFLNAFPQSDPGQPVTSGVYTARFTGSFANKATLNSTSVRIDHTFNSRFSIFGRYNDAPSQTLDRIFSLNDLEAIHVNTQTLTLGVNMALSNRISNTLRGNYSTQRAGLKFSLDSFGGAVPLDPSLLLGSLPSTTNSAFFNAFDANSYSLGPGSENRSRQLNFVDGLGIAVGAHQLKFGGDYRAIFLDTIPAQHGVDAIVSSLQGFVSPPTAGQVFLVAGSEQPAHLLTQAFSLYGQDTWKITRKLTLTYGLRWEIFPAPSARGSTILASWTHTSNPAQIGLAPSGTPIWATTYGNFAPRIGIAYSLTDKGDFVVRAGGGIFYDLGVGESAALGGAFPNTAVNFVPGVPLPIADATPFLPAFPSLRPPFPDGVLAFEDNLRLPRSYQWNVALEKSFGDRQVVSATYVGQAGRDLLRQIALFQPNSNFQGGLFLDENDARSNYDALQVQYRRPLSSRVQALLNYTWSHSLDNASNDVILGLPNTTVSGASDYASSDFDVRHSFSGALTYSIPSAARSGPVSFLTRDWSLDTVIVVRSGFPFNANVTSVSVDPGGHVTTRPDRTPGQPLYLQGSQCARVFQGLGTLTQGQSCPGGKGLNPAAFSVPSTVRQGTEGRNDIPGFGLTQVDLSIGRKFSFTERISLQFRADAFNVFNHPNFTNPAGSLDCGPTCLLSLQMLNQGLGGLTPLFQEGGPRSLQLSLKLSF
jgi:hypothetical protein